MAARVGTLVPTRWVGTLAILGAICFWGLTPTATRALVSELNAGQILLWRFVGGTIFVLVLLITLRPRMPARRDLPLAVGLGLFGVLGFNVPVAYGIERVEGGIAAMIIGIQPLMLVVFAALRLKEELRPRTILGLVIALAGSILVAVSGNVGVELSAGYLFGCALVFFGATMYALYSVLAKPHLGERIPAPSIAMIGTSAALPFMIPVAGDGFIDALGELSVEGWLAALVLALGASVLAPVLFNIGLSLGRASDAGVLLNLVPAIGVISSVLLLGEELALTSIIGGSAIISGVAIATVRRRRRLV